MTVSHCNLRSYLIYSIPLDPPDPPPVWTHPCKCTLIAHESCLIHWIKTQERDFGRSRGELKCPQCGDLYEFEGFNPLSLRILNFANRALSRSGRVILTCCTGTIIVSLGAGE
jgi:E3 ubiquitin-protein ligase DOA10